MNPTPRYRVVGVRADGSKRLLCGQLATKDLADRVCALLAAEVHPFTSLAVEPDDGQITGSPGD